MLPAAPTESDAVSLLKDIVASHVQDKNQLYIFSEYLQTFTLEQIVEQYYATHSSNMMRISIPFMILNFKKIEESETSATLDDKTWESVKTIMRQKVDEYLR